MLHCSFGSLVGKRGTERYGWKTSRGLKHHWAEKGGGKIDQSVDRTLKCDHSLKSCALLWCCLFFNFMYFVILENSSVLALALSGVKVLNW